MLQADAVNSYLKSLVTAYNRDLPAGKSPLPNIPNHTFRHTFSTRLNEMNINMRAMQAILGHASVQTTMNIYTDVSTEFIADQPSVFGTQ
ncbi:MAG: tyrosine-type recombinase/integrase [Clostridia bacterium]|nr:tyrosine-type recombinase/integrase [Clostridia bacterium]